MNDLFELLGIGQTTRAPKRKFDTYLEVSYIDLKSRKILVRDKRDGFLILSDYTRSNPYFCAPYSQELEQKVQAIFGMIQLVREEAALKESELRRRLFRVLKDANKE